MTKVTTYIAYDQTEFEDENSCKEYEEMMRKKFGAVVGFDYSGKVLRVFDGVDFFEESCYIFMKNQENVASLIEELKEWGYTYRGINAEAPGLYIWKHSDQEWINAEKVIQEYQMEIDRITSVMDHAKKVLDMEPEI